VNTFNDRTNISFPLQLPSSMQSSACVGSTVVPKHVAELQPPPSTSSLIGSIVALLDENAVQYCVLKRLEVMSDVAVGALELAVNCADRKRLPELLSHLPRDRYQPVQCIGVDPGVDHFHFALFDGSLPQFLRVVVLYLRRNVLLSAVQNEIFVRRRRQRNFWMAAPADEFSYLLAKSSQARRLTDPDKERLKLLAESLGTAGAEAVAGQLFGLAVRAEVVTACCTGTLGTILHKLRPPIWHSNLAHRNVRSLLAVIRKGWQLLHNWFHPNGLLITILGPDGAGKTTISKKIFDVLGPAFGPQKFMMWRPEALPRLWQDPSAIDLPHSKPPHGALQSLARILATFLDYWIGHFILVKPLLSSSGLIVYDRDIHDILVDSRRYRYGGPKWVLPLLTNALPRIESLFLTLDAAPEVILRRKQEVPPEELRRQLAAYRTLSTELPNSHLIQTDGGLEATTSAVTRSIVDHLGRRYRQRYARKQAGDALPVKTKRLQAWAATVMAASDLYSQRRSWLKKGLLAVLDQGLISGSNFLLAILLARWLSPEQYGAYALSFAIFVLFSFIQQGLFLEPMSVFGPSIYRNSQREYLGTLVWLHGALAGGILALGLFAVAALPRNDSGSFQMALLGMAFSAPCVLFYWFSRRAFYLQLRPGSAAGGAVLYWALLSIGVWLLFRNGLVSPFTAFLAMGVAALTTSVLQLRQLRPILFKGGNTCGLWEVGHRHWNYGRWAILGSLFIWIPWGVYYPVVAHFSGLAEVANLRALLNLALPVTQALSAFTLLFLPHASHVSEQEDWEGARGLALRITAFFVMGTVVYWLPVCLFRAPLLQFLYAGHYSEITRLVPWIAFSSVLSGVALGPTIAFRAMQSPSTVSFFYFVASAVTLVLGIPATRLYGIPGAVTCLLLSNFVAVVLGWTMLVRQARQRVGSRLVQQQAIL
jgi:O-antigen/teichoic acid export membrane protein/thymidylate kinase